MAPHLSERYDAVVVGAGPAGSAAALTIARGGGRVALLERGEYPGCKNVFGGTIYAEATASIFPAFWEEAPLERPVVTDLMWFTSPDSIVSLGFTGLRFGQAPYNKFTALRAKFDRWMAGKAAEAGAEVFTEALVRDFVRNRRVFGGVILNSGEQILADVVIIAEGAGAFLTKKAGLRTEIPTHTLTLYAKEVLSLPAGVIEDRFHLPPGEGSNISIIGDPMAGAVGKVGIWTNKESLSVIAGAYLNQLADKGLSPYALLQRAKRHPIIQRLLEGAEVEEYQSHIIPKGGFKLIPKLFADGVLVAGDAAVMVSGRHGTDLAMLTGQLAGETALLAKAKGDFSAATLGQYRNKVHEMYFMKDIKRDKDPTRYYREHPDSDYLCATAVNRVGYGLFAEKMLSDADRKAEAMSEVLSLEPPLKLGADVLIGLQHWRVL